MASRRTYAVDALVLHHTKLGETDLILTLLTREGSLVRAVAKGARKGGGRFAARTGLFCECSLLLAQGRNLDVVTEAQLINPHLSCRMTPERMIAASRVCELASLMCLEEVEDPYLFAITQRALATLEETSDEARFNLLVAAFYFKMLAHGGWRPELTLCTSCDDENASFFSCEAGGLVCESCAHNIYGAFEISANDISWLRALVSRTFAELLKDDIDVASASRLLEYAQAWCESQLDIRLRSFITVV